MSNTTFKSYSEKSKAKRALRSKVENEALADSLLQQVDGKWGFYVNEDGSPTGSNTVDEDGVEQQVEVQPVDETNNEVEEKVEELQPAENQLPEEEPEQEAPSPTPSAFENFVMSQLTAESNKPAPEPKREPASTSGLKIEKDRPMQNGVKRPSAGGMCRAVWDMLDEHRTKTGTVMTAAQVKAAAETKGWNANNASIEFYQWRKFNGIKGRQQ